MPITKIVGTPRCMPPSASELVAQGYMAGTEWTCEDGSVFILSTVGIEPFWILQYRIPEETP